jgi:regulator of protease activity HflC (stomatin/prohibitin superfamily)
MLRRRIIAVVRDVIRDETSRMPSEDLLKSESTIGRSALIRLRSAANLRRIGVVPVGVFVRAVKLPPEINNAIEARALQRTAMKVELGAAIGDSQAWQAPAREAQEPSALDYSTGMECTEECPFRLWCGDYMSNMKDGKFWCTLFHEFST